MRVIVGAAAAVLLFSSVASAQTPVSPSTNCTVFAPAPTAPDGATATSAQINAANTEYQAWGNARLAQLQTCRAEYEAIEAQLNLMRDGYNAANEELRTVGEAFQVEVEEFNARGASRRGNRSRN